MDTQLDIALARIAGEGDGGSGGNAPDPEAAVAKFNSAL